MSTVVCIGTGPSFDLAQIERARSAGYRLFGCNRTYQDVPDLEVLYGTNERFWDHYWHKGLAEHPAAKWTTNLNAANAYQINYMRERMGYGLCEDEDTIHHGHGAGFSLVSMAHKFGATRVLLIGYDLKYAPDYDGQTRRIGSTPRHYFGEYDPVLQHWPSKQVKGGEHVELIELYRSVHEQGLIDVLNCSPQSALMDVIPYARL